MSPDNQITPSEAEDTNYGKCTPKTIPGVKGKKMLKVGNSKENCIKTAIDGLIEQHKKNRKELDSQMTDPTTAFCVEDLQNLCRKDEKLSPQISSYPQLQISRLFFNAENPTAVTNPTITYTHKYTTSIYNTNEHTASIPNTTGRFPFYTVQRPCQ